MNIACRIATLIIVVALALGCDSPRTSPTTPAVQGSAATDLPEHKTPPAESLDYARYAIQAEKVVKQFLKHPLDANFNPGWLSAADVQQVETDRITVKGKVVCKNDFGGELTSTYSVAFTVALDVVMVVIDDEIVYGNPAFLSSATVENSAPVETFRTWTDDTGKFTIEAQFVEFKGGKVRLRKRDGSVIELTAERLSKDDVTWYRDELKRRKSAKQ